MGEKGRGINKWVEMEEVEGKERWGGRGREEGKNTCMYVQEHTTAQNHSCEFHPTKPCFLPR